VKILIVDDSQEICDLIKSMLSNHISKWGI